MKRVLACWIVLCALSMSAVECISATNSVDRCAGYIEEIKGTVILKHDAKSKPVKLDGKQDRFRKLYAGERLQVGKGGLVKLKLYSGMTELKGSSEWYPIPLVTWKKGDRVVEAMHQYADIGGRERGASSAIYTPAEGSRIRPETVVFHWIPAPGTSKVSLSIHDEEDKEIWRQGGIDAGPGAYVSDTARGALVSYRAGGGFGDIVLTLTDQQGNSSDVRFSLLSEKLAKALDQELSDWDAESTAFLRHVGRASAFEAKGMWSDAADEYEAALAEAPESTDLLRATIWRQKRIGNTARANELVRRGDKMSTYGTCPKCGKAGTLMKCEKCGSICCRGCHGACGGHCPYCRGKMKDI